MKKKIAFIFPGQGSQHVGMLDKYLAHSEDYKQIITGYFDRASEVLGYDALEVAQRDPLKQLDETCFTQPLLLTTSYVFWKLWLHNGGRKPDYMSGHSLGEYTALLCSQAFSLEEALELVKVRAQLMQAAVPNHQGSMGVIIGLESNQVSDICLALSKQNAIVESANFNSPLQVVVSGHSEAVKSVLKQAKEAGAKLTKLLPISVPSHSSLMNSIAQDFALRLEKVIIKAPQIPVINNAEIKINSDSDSIKSALIKQLYLPVNWVETIKALIALDVHSYVECGPGKVLIGLCKRIDKTLELHSLSSPDYIVSTVDN